ncbi:hypothetical protein, partial [Nocardia sp. NPDC004722]
RGKACGQTDPRPAVQTEAERLECWMCGAEGRAAEAGLAVLCADCSDRYISARCLECGVLQTSLRSRFSEICSQCTVRAEWPGLPVEARTEFDRLLREGRKIQAVRAVRDGSGMEPKPSLHWAMDALVYRAKALGLEGS